MNLAELTPQSYAAAQFASHNGETCGFWLRIGKVDFVWDTDSTFWVDLCEAGLENIKDGMKMATFVYLTNLSDIARRHRLSRGRLRRSSSPG